MVEKTSEQLRKEWVMTMLYGSGQNINELVENGCRVMVFGIEYEDFVKTLHELKDENYISIPPSDGNPCKLTTKGIFFIKKNTLLPLIRLTENPDLLETFVDENKTRCDTDFLEELSTRNPEDNKIDYIKHFAQQHYMDIGKILSYLHSYLD